MAESPDYDDFLELEGLFEAARKAVSGTARDSPYPKYPEEVWALMNYIQRSQWGDSGYNISQIAPTLQKISEATIDEVRCVLTGFSRGERFSDGYFFTLFDDNKFERVIDRARELTRP